MIITNMQTDPPRQWSYEAVPMSGFHEDYGEYQTFGIRCCGGGRDDTIQDVTTEREAAIRLADLLTAHQLSPLHFREAITDFMP